MNKIEAKNSDNKVGNLEYVEAELWRDIKGFENRYQVSNQSRVRSLIKARGHKTVKRNKPYVLKQYVNIYLKVNLHKNGRKFPRPVHRLVARAFIPNSDNKPFINHKDGDKLNNELTNLEWCTHKENHAHAARIGLMEKGENRYNSKLTKDDVIEIKYIYNNDPDTSQRKLAKRYNVSQRLIWNIVNGKAWVHV